MHLYKKIIKNILKNAVIIFVYHDVSNKPSNFSVENDLNISPEVFLSQVRTINNLFNIISPIELIDGDFERPAALFTFDDGFKSYFDNALPILESCPIPSIRESTSAPVASHISANMYEIPLELFLSSYNFSGIITQ